MLPPPSVGLIFGFLKRHPDQMFVFTDQMACLIYDKETQQVHYLIGGFDTDKGSWYNTHVAYQAKMAQRQ